MTPIYRDASAPVEHRVEDLLMRMTLEEKAGQLFHNMITVGEEGTLTDADPMFGLSSAHEYVVERHMTHFNVLAAPPTAREFALWHNRLQELAASTRLGIPVTVSSDPRHAFTDNPGTALPVGPFSQWPETLGLAATRNEQLVEEHAEAVRQEYLAVGIRTGLHPQVDLLTEPRWARGGATFGEDVALTGRLGAAYVRGLQATGAIARASGLDGKFGTESVSTMTKHFPGGGPQKDGEDPHFSYGREQIYPGNRFAEHLAPFVELVAAGTRQMMPYYGMPVGLVIDGQEIPQVGFGFNRPVITGLLRDKLGFEGIVCADWGLVTDAEVMGQPFPARAWGVEHLSRPERVATILEAGVDQLGGEACPELVVEVVRSGRISEDRIDASVRRLLCEKFLLGLFDDHRYVDVDAAERTVGSPQLRAAGLRAQSEAITVLTRPQRGAAQLPLRPGLRIYAEGVDPEALARYGTVANSPHEADVALLRLKAPYEHRGPGFQSFFHAGSLEFPAADLEHITAITTTVPTIVDIYLDRPAILTPIREAAAVLVVNFGASDHALLDALTGQVPPRGRLPFDLPRSMAAVEASRPDVAFDTADPLFRFGHGLHP
ncbi:glycoside hydrolase family 3 protein [Kocuria rosea]|uniref:glycoside hydrolase family 3 protein n=1 Tax=Kocuria rosea TaxID=1275 RepID=UPI000E066336|nr:glycoside hydrolase family 3 N-terminal domain-containing protein [Kocuria rosea]STX05702.1 Periplasmic beta-glucosidase precursor [Kocuria rosea]